MGFAQDIVAGWNRVIGNKKDKEKRNKESWAADGTSRGAGQADTTNGDVSWFPKSEIDCSGNEDHGFL